MHGQQNVKIYCICFAANFCACRIHGLAELIFVEFDFGEF